MLKMINDTNPAQGDWSLSVAKVITIWYTVGPGSAQQRFFI